MDNKQDRLFYWEVKDFLTKTKNPDINSVKRASTLKEDIKKIMSLNSPFYVDKDLVQPRISDEIRNSVLPLISLNESSIKSATPRNVGSSPNITSNLFNLREAPSFGSLGGGASTGGPSRRPNDGPRSWRDEHPEEYAANVTKRTEEETARKNRVADNTRRSQEDDAYQYTQSIATTGGKALEMQGPAKDENGKDTGENPNLPTDSPQNRENLRNFRAKRDLTRQTDQISAIIDRTSKQDPSTLSARDAGALALAKIQMKGGDMSNPTAGLEDRVKSKVATLQGKNVLSPELSGSGNQMQDDIDALAAAKKTPEEAAQDAAARTTATARSKAYFDADTKSTFDVSRDATRRDVAQREKQNMADAAQQAADRKEKMQGVKISGTNMTYGEFKANTGRDYDATNKDDSSLVIKQAGAMGGRYSSEEARQTAGSADNLINLQKTASDARAVESGKRKRDIDKSTQELSDFKYNPTIRAREMAKEKAAIMPQVMAQINAENSKRDRLEAEGRALAVADKAKIAADKETALKADLEKNSIRIPSKTYVEPGPMGPPKPTIPFMLGGTEQRPAKKPFLPTPTGGENDGMVVARGAFRDQEQRKAFDAARAKEQAIATSTMLASPESRAAYQKELDLADEGNRGYPLGDESLVTRSSEKFSADEIPGMARAIADWNNPNIPHAPDSISLPPSDRLDAIETQARKKAKADRLQRLKDQAPPNLISKPNNGLPGDAAYGAKSEYGTSLLSDIMQSGASTTPGTSSTSRPAVAPGSPKDIEDQLKRLRGQ